MDVSVQGASEILASPDDLLKPVTTSSNGVCETEHFS